MRIETTQRTLYTLDELSEDAQQKALEVIRELNSRDFEFHQEHVIEQAKEAASLLGVTIEEVYYSGFWSQGDGACFKGTYEYRKGAVKAIAAEWPQDERLQSIASDWQALQRKTFYSVSGDVKQSGHYMHDGCTVFNVYQTHNGGYYPSADIEETTKEILRDFMRWIYARLEAEYEYQASEEQAREIIDCNAYEFTTTGALA